MESTSPSMRPVGRRARVAMVATTTVALAALGGFGGWAALSTDASTGQAAQESRLSEAYGQGALRRSPFELAVREDQLEPTPPNRRRVNAAVLALRATLPAIDRNGDQRDRALTAELRRQIDATAIGVDHLMTAAESFDAVGVDRLNRVRWRPTSAGSRRPSTRRPLRTAPGSRPASRALGARRSVALRATLRDVRPGPAPDRRCRRGPPLQAAARRRAAGPRSTGSATRRRGTA